MLNVLVTVFTANDESLNVLKTNQIFQSLSYAIQTSR